MTVIEILSDVIADGYWTLCSPEEAVEAFRSDVVDDGGGTDRVLVEIDGFLVGFTQVEIDAAAALFIARSVG